MSETEGQGSAVNEGSFDARVGLWARTKNAETRHRLASELDSLYETAWQSGDEIDRAAVLLFVALTRTEPGFRLIREALHSEDPMLVQRAFTCASVLADNHINLGGEAFTRELLEARLRFPSAARALPQILEAYQERGWLQT